MRQNSDLSVKQLYLNSLFLHHKQILQCIKYAVLHPKYLFDKTAYSNMTDTTVNSQ